MKRTKSAQNVTLLAGSLAALFTTLPGAQAGRELFTARAVAQDGSGLRASESSSSFIDLVSNVIKAENRFAVFQDRAGFASLDYAGVPNAITFQQNGSGTRAVLRIPVTGLEKTFTGRNRDDVNDQIEDYLRKNGSDEYEKFLKAINQQSPVSPIDGNPNAATAQMANATFGEFGFPSGETQRGNPSGISILGTAGRFTAGEFQGDAYTLPLGFTIRASEKVSVVVNIPLSYIDVEGSQIFTVGTSLSLPVRILQAAAAVEDTSKDGKGTPSTPAQPWTWQLTPTVGAIATGSQDFATGGVIGQLAATNMLSYNFTRFTLAMGNHVSWLEGIPVSVEGYKVSGGVSQVLLKNGLQASVPLGERWLFTAYGLYTRFLDDAAVVDYFTVGAEIGFKFLANSPSYLKLGFYSDIGSNYESGSIRFGSGWRF